jgi:hypothetical protein
VLATVAERACSQLSLMVHGVIIAPVTTTSLHAGPNYNCVAFNKRVSTCSARQRKAGDPGFDPTNNYLGYGTPLTPLARVPFPISQTAESLSFQGC